MELKDYPMNVTDCYECEYFLRTMLIIRLMILLAIQVL